MSKCTYYLNNSHMRYLILSLSILLANLVSPSFIHAGLNFNHDKVYNYEEIDSTLKREVHLINEKVIELLKKRDVASILKLFIDEVKSEKKGVEQLSNMIKVIPEEMLRDEYDYYDDFYLERSGIGFGWNQFSMTRLPAQEFSIVGLTKSNRLYASLMRTTGMDKDTFLAIIYSNNGEEWKIQNLHIGIIEIGGKSALEWHDEIKSDYEDGRLIPALLKVTIAGEVLRPAPFFQYSKEREITSFVKRILKEGKEKYDFPMTLQHLESRPSLFAIIGQYHEGEVVAVVKYVTSYGLTDGELIEKEAHEMTPFVEENFPGIAGKGNRIFYLAYPELPELGKYSKHYGTEVKIK